MDFKDFLWHHGLDLLPQSSDPIAPASLHKGMADTVGLLDRRCHRERERQRDRERQRQRERVRQRQRGRQKETDREKESQTDREQSVACIHLFYSCQVTHSIPAGHHSAGHTISQLLLAGILMYTNNIAW